MTLSGCQQGGCVCQKIRYRFSGAPLRVTICHCTWCQRRTGSAFGVELVVNKAQFELVAGVPAIYRHVSDVSGRWVDQHFCNNCGSNIGLTLEAVPAIRSIAIGSLDDQGWPELSRLESRHVFVSSARHWSVVPDDVEQYEVHFRQ